jgi:hypothetical protein
MTAASSIKDMIDWYYTKSVDEKCNTCHIGSWAINRELARPDQHRTSFLDTILALLKRSPKACNGNDSRHSVAHTVAAG